jgi:hypothetical protein
MIYRSNRIFGMLIILTSVIVGIIGARADEQQDMSGWGVEDPYHKHYDVNKFESFKARVVKIKKVVPMPGMSPAVALDVKYDSKIIEVQICPTWFIRPDEIGIKKGDKIKIRGVRANINGKEVFMASKIKKGDFFQLKVRLTRDGRPFWTMIPKEITRERLREQE